MTALGVRETARDILKIIINYGIESGSDEVLFNYPDVMKALSIEDHNYFHFCVCYLFNSGCLSFKNLDQYSGIRRVGIKAKAIDFVCDMYS